MTTRSDYPSGEEFGTPPQFAWLSLDDLVVDARYQRRITGHGWKRIRAMAREFSWSRFGALLVSKADKLGDHAVFDGQHRLEAARLVDSINRVPCLVVDAPEVADQARAFKSINKDRIGVSRINIFWADLAAGEPMAQAVKAICDDCGVTISHIGTGRQKPKTTVATAALTQCLKLNEAALRRALAALVAAQGEAENAFRASTIKALTRIYDENADRVDDTRLVRALAEMDLDDKIDEARAGAKSLGGKPDLVLQMLLARAYNKGLGAARRLFEPTL